MDTDCWRIQKWVPGERPPLPSSLISWSLPKNLVFKISHKHSGSVTANLIFCDYLHLNEISWSWKWIWFMNYQMHVTILVNELLFLNKWLFQNSFPSWTTMRLTAYCINIICFIIIYSAEHILDLFALEEIVSFALIILAIWNKSAKSGSKIQTCQGRSHKVKVKVTWHIYQM